MFKVGDLVRVRDTGTNRDGTTGVVIEVRDEPETWNIDVRIEDDDIAFAEEELEPVFKTFADGGYVPAGQFIPVDTGYIVRRENAPIQVGDKVAHRFLGWSGVVSNLDTDKAHVVWGDHPASWLKIGDLIRERPWKAGDEVTIFNAVSKPEHYSKGLPEGVEVIDIIRAQKGSWEFSNAVKYLLRAQFKGNYIQDLEKCVQYLTWEIERNGDPEWRDGTDD